MNDYEAKNSEDGLDIPDFLEDTKTGSSTSIDMSIFKMSDDELYDDNEVEEDEDDNDDFEDLKPKKRRKSNTPIIICLITIIILLATCIGAFIYAVNQHKAYVDINTKYVQVQANEENYKKQLAEKDATIEALQAQINNSGSGSGQSTSGTVYEIVDGPITFRKEPTSDAEATTFNGKEYAETGDKLTVIEVVNDKDVSNGPKWAKVADNVYFCLGNDDDNPWAKKVN